MRILITGFTPFDNESINPSWEIAQSVHAPEGVELVRLQIPTEFNKGAQKVIEKIEEVHPNAVLSLGQFGGSACFNVSMLVLTVELRAYRIIVDISLGMSLLCKMVMWLIKRLCQL